MGYDSERKEHAIAVESVRVETARQNAQRAFAAKRAEMRSDLCLSDRTCEELRVDLNTSWNQGADQYTCAEEQLLYMGHKGCFGQSHPVLDQSSWTLKGQWVLSQNQDSCSAACSAHGL